MHIFIGIFLILVLSACAETAAPLPVQPVVGLQEKAAANVSAALAPEPPRPATVTGTAPPPPVTAYPVPESAPHPSPNEMWIADGKFNPPVLIVAEGTTVSLINKNNYVVTIVPSPANSNGAVYLDPVTNRVTVNGANFNNVLPPEGSAAVTLLTGGAFIFYCETNPDVTGMILVGG